jgi:hypothetical protein
MYKRILLAYDGSIEAAPPFGKVLYWQGNAALKSFCYPFSPIPYAAAG